MSEKKYVIEGNWAVCTDGQIQRGIVVETHESTFSTPSSRLIATSSDRFRGNFNCAKIINAAGFIGTIVGAVVGGKIGTAIGGVLSICGAVVGGVKGAALGSEKGSEVGGDIGAKLGGNVGSAVGTGVGANIGANVGGTTGAIRGGIEGTIEGAQKGAETGGAIGSTVGRDTGTGVGAGIGANIGGTTGAIQGGIDGAMDGTQKGAEIGGDIGSTVGGRVGTVQGALTGTQFGHPKTGAEIGEKIGSTAGGSVGTGTGATIGANAGGADGAIRGGIDGAQKGAEIGGNIGGDIGSTVGDGLGTAIGAGIGANVGGTTGAIRGGIEGTIDGAQKGAKIGGDAGRVAGTAGGSFVGGGVGGALGGIGGGVAGVVGGSAAVQIVGTVGGAIAGSIIGSIAGSSIARGAMNTFFPKMCNFLTSRSQWSSVHENMLIEKKTALMPDATLNCFFGGIVSLAIPNMKEAIACAYASMGIYRDPNEDERRPEGEEAPGIIDDVLRDFFGIGSPNYYDSDGDNYNDRTDEDTGEKGQSHKYFDKYDPRQFGWEEVDEEFAQNIADKSKVPYITETLVDKDGNPLLDENGNERTNSYFRNDKSGTKVEMYKTPDGDIVMVSRGTHNHKNGSSNRDWIDDNGNQGIFGNSDQYDEDARIAAATRKQMEEDGKDGRFVTTGHSMAGGKTTLSGATGQADATYAFNPAGVHPRMYAKHNKSATDAANTFVFSAKNDFLTNMNDNLWIAPDHAGKRIVFDTGSELGDVVDSHDMPMLIKAMEKYMAECPDVDLVAHYD